MKALRDHGPTPIHRRSFAPVAAAYRTREGLFAKETTS
jgi:ribonuclease HII